MPPLGVTSCLFRYTEFIVDRVFAQSGNVLRSNANRQYCPCFPSLFRAISRLPALRLPRREERFLALTGATVRSPLRAQYRNPGNSQQREPRESVPKISVQVECCRNYRPVEGCEMLSQAGHANSPHLIGWRFPKAQYDCAVARWGSLIFRRDAPRHLDGNDAWPATSGQQHHRDEECRCAGQPARFLLPQSTTLHSID